MTEQRTITPTGHPVCAMTVDPATYLVAGDTPAT
jgi:hypothetical protein